MKKLFSCLKLMRVKHYFKNLLIFVPLIFSMSFYNLENNIKTIIGFILFSLTCSIIYIINDLNDIEKDKKHPRKSKRPLASGELSKKQAYILLIAIAVIVIIVNILMGFNIYSILVLASYLILNILYSKIFKNIPILDVVCLVIGFVLRIIYGALIINVEVSNWLYLTIISLSFYLALGKRRNELQIGTDTREVLKFYNKDFLNKNMYMFLTLTIVFYSMWCVDDSNIIKFNNRLIFTVPILMIICMKYSLIIENQSEGDPVEILFSDKILMLLVLIFIIIMGIIVLV